MGVRCFLHTNELDNVLVFGFLEIIQFLLTGDCYFRCISEFSNVLDSEYWRNDFFFFLVFVFSPCSSI